MASTRVGISGWRYPEFRRGAFYPVGLVQRRELAWMAERLSTVEINGAFYSLQRPESYRRWHDETPPGFVFAVKGGRFLTHMKKLRDPEVPLANFFASGVLRLGEKLGPIVWQLPEMVAFDAERLDRFLALLPRTTDAAAALAEHHGPQVAGRAWTTADAPGRPIRYALEVRNPTFFDRADAFTALLRRHGVAFAIADTAGRWGYAEWLTADFTYVRLHGSRQLYVSGYDDRELDGWAEKLIRWNAAGLDAWVYFDNTGLGHAGRDALALAGRIHPGPASSTKPKRYL